VLVATMGISFLLGFVSQIAAFGAAQIEPMLAVAILLVAQIVTMVVQVFLGIGQVKVCLELARTGRSEFGTLFTGGDRILPVLGFSILAGVAVTLGFVLLIVPGILLILFFWGSYYEVVDGRSKVMDSFSNAYEYCKLNVGTTFVIGLAGFGIVMLGFLALLIGVIFAVPLVMMMQAVAYLMMSGQISVQGR
jgi:hypothetical protein